MRVKVRNEKGLRTLFVTKGLVSRCVLLNACSGQTLRPLFPSVLRPRQTKESCSFCGKVLPVDKRAGICVPGGRDPGILSLAFSLSSPSPASVSTSVNSLHSSIERWTVDNIDPRLVYLILLFATAITCFWHPILFHKSKDSDGVS